MALTYADWIIWNKLKDEGSIPQSPELLEIGQANWYGDVDPMVLLKAMADAGIYKNQFTDAFEAAKDFYALMFTPRRTFAIDLQGQPDAHKLDLNLPHPQLHHSFDVVVNTGTTEHVFDQRQVFETVHDACRVNGLMLHAVPWRGWLDHGFYCYQPTFFLDLAAGNEYSIMVLAAFESGTTNPHFFKSMAEIHEMERAGKLPAEAMLYVMMRKMVDKPFRVPMQGYYSGLLAETEKRDWHTMR